MKIALTGASGLIGTPLVTALRTLLWVLLPTTGLLALRSPLLLAALPTLGWRFVSHDEHYWGTDWHYSAVLMPVVFLALVDALDRIGASRRGWLVRYARQIPAAVCAASRMATADCSAAVDTSDALPSIPRVAADAPRACSRTCSPRAAALLMVSAMPP